MKASQYIIPTEKEEPADAVVASHKLMIRAGMIRKSASGLYHYLPLGLKVLKKIENIIREEMDRSGALEFELPILTPAEIWQISGRWDRMGKEMFRQKDRHGVDYCLGPTHEEPFTSVLKPILKSYKDLPRNVYQMHTKFRDEIRPRFGVIRSREFTMKDAYSFHLDDASLDETYQLMRQTYRRIFSRCGLSTIPVQADSGSMGGSGSEEFMVVSPIGEETLALCNACNYSGNVEKTPVISNHPTEKKEYPAYTKVATPDKKSIAEICELLNASPEKTIKAVLLKTDDDRNVVVFIRGDRELNEVKLKNHVNCLEFRMMTDNECTANNLVAGFVGMDAKLPKDTILVIDKTIDIHSGYIVGANETDFHNINFVPSRDFKSELKQVDVCMTIAFDICPNCSAPLKLEKGIEVGHIFKLGNKYTKAFQVTVTDKNGKSLTPTMGCYGIGVNRTMATVIEQSNDESGIAWPISIAPFEVAMVSITKTAEDKSRIEVIYEYLKARKLDVFWDDRDLGPGFKFKDSELIGFPIRLTFGKFFFDKNEFGLFNRKTKKEINISYMNPEAVYNEVMKLRNELYSLLTP